MGERHQNHEKRREVVVYNEAPVCLWRTWQVGNTSFRTRDEEQI